MAKKFVKMQDYGAAGLIFSEIYAKIIKILYYLGWKGLAMERNVLLIVNPHSGDGEAKRWVFDMVDQLLTRFELVTVYFSKCTGDIIRVATEQAGAYDAIVCCGGDGTLNETICGIVASGANPMLGYIPTGTVNDFANSHKIPREIKSAIVKIAKGEASEFDVGVLGERCFSYVAAFGAFTEVSYLTPQGSKAVFGRTAYLAEGAKRLFSLPPIEATFLADGVEIHDRFIYAMAANSKTVGGFRFFDGNDEDAMRDGMLDFLLIRYPDTIGQLQEALSGLLLPKSKSEFVLKVKAKSATFRFTKDVPWTVDGEFGGNYREVTVGCLERRIRVIE